MATARALVFTSALTSGVYHSNVSTSRRPRASSVNIVLLPTLTLGQPLKSAGGQQQKVCSRGHSSRAKRSIAAKLADNGDVEPFVAGDEAYALVSIVDAAEVRFGHEGFVIKMNDGRQVACRHNSSPGSSSPLSGPGGRGFHQSLPESRPQSAIVLQLENSRTMLPVIVAAHASQLLQEALRNVPVTRPTVYQVMKDMLGMMGYELKMVRVTHRVYEAYYARAYLARREGDTESVISLDMRPSDAINLAARAKVPIQVSKVLAQGDGVVPIAQPGRVTVLHGPIGEADKPLEGRCPEAEEFSLVRAVMAAAMLEHYGEAAELRDRLVQFRALQASGSGAEGPGGATQQAQEGQL
eukprot:TRINITY_DN3_c0_g1_i2.p1 TRINITY_DN3_c0_g1~~TRINITY_DN3_c0_g1_i2.p1  ORF type:complete len:354 (+),score=74.96 TRINITY_DN3_c0_g1_i2:366-1427(+)